MEIYSHTLIRNGEPFTKLVLGNVLPFVKKALVTISEKSDDNTLASLQDLQQEFPNKINIDTENVTFPAELTKQRQKQLDNTPKGVWILFLDSDDLWFPNELNYMKDLIEKNENVDGYSINPYQVYNEKYYDETWKNKYFLKWFKNQEGVHYRHPWPRDLIYKNDELLYWRKNSRVPRIAVKFFHLSHIMKWRFRDEDWAFEYRATLGSLKLYPKEEVDKVKTIFNILNEY